MDVMKIKGFNSIKIEDVILALIVLFALLYPIIVAFLIYRSDKPMEDELVRALVEYFEGDRCAPEGPKGLRVENKEDLKSLTNLCQRLSQESFEPREREFKEGKVVLSFGKKVKGMETKLILELTIEGDRITAVKSYEKRR